MDTAQVKAAIEAKLAVTRTMVALAKSFVVNNLDRLQHVSILLPEFLAQHGAGSEPYESSRSDGNTEVIATISINETSHEQIDRFANSVSWHFAFAEAIWSLLHVGIVMPTREGAFQVKFRFKAVPPEEPVNIAIKKDSILLPRHVTLSPSLASADAQILASDDLYLTNLAIPNLDTGVALFIRQSIVCLRNDMYLPCIVMLGAANEGAWSELGVSLLQFAAHSGQMTVNTIQNKQQKFQKANVSDQIDTVVDLYRNQSIFSDIARNSYSLDQLILTRDWAHSLRLARNSIHYNNQANSNPTYDEAAIRLLTARDHFRTVYKIREATNQALANAGVPVI